MRDIADSKPALNCVESLDEKCGEWATLTRQLPEVMRILWIKRLPGKFGRQINVARLFHDSGSLNVEWMTRNIDASLSVGTLVKVRTGKHRLFVEGVLKIDRLFLADRPSARVNLFQTVPWTWCRDRDLVGRAAALMNALPQPLAHLVTALLWDGERFLRFVTWPSSLSGHHNGLNGNFRHSIETTEIVRDLGSRTAVSNVPLLIAAGLVHDVGKAGEYAYDWNRKMFRLSKRGALIGHRDTLIEWLALARKEGKVSISDDSYIELLHTINAAAGAPEWLGLRAPRCLEAEIRSAADRLSGKEDLFKRSVPNEGHAFGRRHPHLSGRSYLTRRDDLG